VKLVIIIAIAFVCSILIFSVGLTPQSFGYAADEVEIIVSVDKSSYKVGDLLTIKGTGAHSYTIFVDIISPSGDQIVDLMFIAASNGDFSTVWIIPRGLDDGTYTIDIRDVKKQTQTTFNIGTVPQLQNLPHEDLKVSPSLKTQIKNGISPDSIICIDGLELIFKLRDNSPACVKPSSIAKLVERGWVIS